VIARRHLQPRLGDASVSGITTLQLDNLYAALAGVIDFSQESLDVYRAQLQAEMQSANGDEFRSLYRAVLDTWPRDNLDV
jgi:hypothetical protein